MSRRETEISLAMAIAEGRSLAAAAEHIGIQLAAANRYVAKPSFREKLAIAEAQICLERVERVINGGKTAAAERLRTLLQSDNELVAVLAAIGMLLPATVTPIFRHPDESGKPAILESEVDPSPPPPAANRQRDSPAYVKIGEVASALSVAYTTVYRMVKRGEIEAKAWGLGRNQKIRIPLGPLIKRFPELAGRFPLPGARKRKPARGKPADGQAEG